MTSRKWGRCPNLLVIVAACSSACSAAHSGRPAMPPDAGPDATQSEPHPVEAADAGALPPPPRRPLTTEEQEWLAEPDFEIGLERTACFGTCPIYKMTLRSTGDVRFTGYRYVWKPGTYDTQVAGSAALKLYSDLISRGIIGLQSSYQTSDDGCPEVWTDSPSSIFTLRARGIEKRIDYDHGCEGDFPDLETLKVIEKQIVEDTNIAPFLKRDAENCNRRAFGTVGTYVLRDPTDTPVGILWIGANDLNARRDWGVSNCDGQEVARGDTVATWDCGNLIVPSIETTFMWPGMDEPQSAVVFEHVADTDGNPPQNIDLRLYTFDGESAQRGEPGDSCR
jgi:hypothetical protein